jgi:hypothetical protein
MNDQLKQAVALAMTQALLANGAAPREILDAGMAVERAKELVG